MTCAERIELGESSLTALLSADFVALAPGHEVLVATQDGLLMAVNIAPTAPDGRQIRDGGGGGGGPSSQDGDEVHHIHINDASLNKLEGSIQYFIWLKYWHQ